MYILVTFWFSVHVCETCIYCESGTMNQWCGKSMEVNILSRSGNNVSCFHKNCRFILTNICSWFSVYVITYQDTAWSYKVRHYLAFPLFHTEININNTFTIHQFKGKYQVVSIKTLLRYCYNCPSLCNGKSDWNWKRVSLILLLLR